MKKSKDAEKAIWPLKSSSDDELRYVAPKAAQTPGFRALTTYLVQDISHYRILPKACPQHRNRILPLVLRRSTDSPLVSPISPVSSPSQETISSTFSLLYNSHFQRIAHPEAWILWLFYNTLGQSRARWFRVLRYKFPGLLPLSLVLSDQSSTPITSPRSTSLPFLHVERPCFTNFLCFAFLFLLLARPFSLRAPRRRIK
jgi:hypothetical protein